MNELKRTIKLYADRLMNTPMSDTNVHNILQEFGQKFHEQLTVLHPPEGQSNTCRYYEGLLQDQIDELSSRLAATNERIEKMTDGNLSGYAYVPSAQNSMKELQASVKEVNEEVDRLDDEVTSCLKRFNERLRPLETMDFRLTNIENSLRSI